MFGAKFGVDKSLCLSGGVEVAMEGVVVLFTLEDDAVKSLLVPFLKLRRATWESDMAMEGDLVGPCV